jgi:hemoglobin
MIGDLYREIGRSQIRPLFGADLLEASRRSAAFYVQLLGGPPLYNQRHGEPMMRRRHLSFRIDETARVVWLGCFYRTLEEAPRKYGFPAEHLDVFRRWLDGFSRWMVNTKQGP